MRALLILITLALAIFALVEVVQADSADVRLLPRPIWAVLIFVLPFLGAVGWLFLGRPSARRPGPPGPTRRSSPRAPDDDPDFLRSLRPPKPPKPEDPTDEDKGDRPPTPA